MHLNRSSLDFTPNIVLLIIACSIFASCVSSKQDKDVENTDQTSDRDSHNGKDSLDWPGLYIGTLPCADCPGIEIILQLNSDSTYRLSEKYLERDTGPSSRTGKLIWNSDENTIVLGAEEESSYAFFVSEDLLYKLDINGDRIEDDLADKYVLKKSIFDTNIEGKKWQLIMLKGRDIDPNKSNVPYIMFDNKGTVSGFTGCNRLQGTFHKRPGSRILFDPLAVTSKLCLGDNLEQEFLSLFDIVDTYTLKNDKLSFSKSKAAYMAQFRAVSEE